MNLWRALASALRGGFRPGLRPHLAEALAAAAKVWRAEFADGESAFAAAAAALDVASDVAPAAWRVFRAARASALGLEAYGALLRRRLADRPEARTEILGAVLGAGPPGPRRQETDAALRRFADALGAAAPITPEDSPWRILRIQPGSGLEAVRAAWRREIRLAHPDVALARGAPAGAVARATAHAARVNAAYAILSGRSGPAAA